MIITKTKTLLLIGLIGFLFACQEKSENKPDYAIVKGKITNAQPDKKLRLYNPESSENTLITVQKDGVFQDTLYLEQPTYYNWTYNGIFKLYLSNGMDLQIDFDAEKSTKNLSFTGKGAIENQYLQFKTKAMNDLVGADYRKFLSLDQEAYDQKIQQFKKNLSSRLKRDEEKMDSAFINSQKEKMDDLFASLNDQRKDQLAMNGTVGKGKESPVFKDYKNYKGGTSSLKDYRGNYVYIDVWATWCVPCIAEIPHLKQLEKKYGDKNIKFLSLSVDNLDQEDKWRKMVKDKSLDENGIQLLADNAMRSDFIKAYHINAIPRFILLDPDGKIIKNDAPRPSEEKLKTIFDKLDI